MLLKMILSRRDSNYKHASLPEMRFSVIARRVLHQCKSKREVLVNSSQMRQRFHFANDEKSTSRQCRYCRDESFRCGKAALRFNRSACCGKVARSAKLLQFFHVARDRGDAMAAPELKPDATSGDT